MKASELITILQKIIDKHGDHIVGAYNGVYADIIEKDDVYVSEIFRDIDQEDYEDTHIICLYNNEPEDEDW